MRDDRSMEDGERAISPDRWVDCHGDYLYQYALARVREPAVAEDLVQETFLAALKSRDRFSGQSSERTWLVGILRHKFFDYLRRKGRSSSPPITWDVSMRGRSAARGLAALKTVNRMAGRHFDERVSHGDAGFGFGMRTLYSQRHSIVRRVAASERATRFRFPSRYPDPGSA
jgi:RNA polymerase sigma factor (sigma-70 family)